jgi:hypothetical protein
VSFSHQKMRAAFCVGDRKLVRQAARQAVETRRALEVVQRVFALDRVGHGLFSSAAWKVTPSRMAWRSTVRPWRAASASSHSLAMYEYGDEKSK